MNTNSLPTRSTSTPIFLPCLASPAQWRPQVFQELAANTQHQRAILIHDDPVFAHHLHATFAHAGTRVCSLTPTTTPYSAHAATVILSADLDTVWRLLLHEDALTGSVRPTTLFLLLSPDRLALPYLPQHFRLVIANTRAFDVRTIIFDLNSQLGGARSEYRNLAHTAACPTE